ncbi:MAG: GNAT family N-acetyltransferase [Candidatus Bathyarchaeota archaeon]|nr:GNAT family N-acetyltransferase [Candidatus Bathyarchaeota archaeon]
MSCTERLELFWRDLVLGLSLSKKREGTIFVCYPQIPLYALNHAAGVDPEANTQVLLEEVEEYFRLKGMSYACFRVSPLTPNSFVSLLQQAGFEPKGEQAVMVLQTKTLPKETDNGFTVKRVTTDAEIEVFNNLLVSIFQMPPEWKSGFDDFTRDCLQNGWTFYLSYLQEKPVGTCALFSSKGIGGIFDVGTLITCRNRGIGTALTIQALKDSIAKGNKIHTLQTEKNSNAQKLYEKLGFTTDHTVQYYTKDPPPKQATK